MLFCWFCFWCIGPWFTTGGCSGLTDGIGVRVTWWYSGNNLYELNGDSFVQGNFVSCSTLLWPSLNFLLVATNLDYNLFLMYITFNWESHLYSLPFMFFVSHNNLTFLYIHVYMKLKWNYNWPPVYVCVSSSWQSVSSHK